MKTVNFDDPATVTELKSTLPFASSDFVILNGITLVRVNADPQQAVKENRTIHCANIWGRLDGLITAETVDGKQELEGMGGSFYLQNVQSGGLFRSSRMFLPTALTQLLLKGIPEEGREFYAQVAAMPTHIPTHPYAWIGVVNMGDAADDPAMNAVRLQPPSRQTLLLTSSNRPEPAI
jgi:hypothetical protein